MRRVLVLAVAAVIACACSRENVAAGGGTEAAGAGAVDAATKTTAAPKGKGAGATSLRVEPAVIVDANGFEQPIGAATLFIPHGWKTQGGVAWGQQHMCTNGYAFDWRATSPDGLSSIGILPAERWESNTYGAPASSPGCKLAPWTNVRQYLEALVQRLRPGARVVSFRVRDDLQKEFAALNTVTPMPAGEIRTTVDAGEVLVAYEEKGRAMRATVAAVAVFSHNRSNYGMGDMHALSAYTFPAYAVSAPEGQLDAALFEAIRRSIKISPQWEQRIANHNAAIGRVAIEESRKRANIIAKTNEEISRIRQETWDAQQESSDRRMREFGEVIREVETYDDADAPGGQVELSHMYDHAWRLNDGTYVLTNDPSFDPSRNLQVEGRKLEATK